MAVELPHFAAFPLNDSAAGREVIRSYYRDYLPVAQAAGRSFLRGKPLGVAIAEVDEATGGYPAYYMINCAYPRHFARELTSGAPWVGRIGGLRANASAKSHAELDASPEIDIGDIAGLADDHAELLPSLPNLQLIGGCCGTAISPRSVPAASTDALYLAVWWRYSEASHVKNTQASGHRKGSSSHRR